MSGLSGKVAVITGAGQGIGRAYARAYAEAGISPVIVDIEKDKIDSVRREIKMDIGLDCLALRADITSQEDIEVVIKKSIDRHGRIDILINNAGTNADNLSLIKIGCSLRCTHDNPSIIISRI